jgi:hypothetical protein
MRRQGVAEQVKPREWDIPGETEWGPQILNGIEVVGWHHRAEGQDEAELLAGFEAYEAAYGLSGHRPLQLRAVFMREASSVECNINGWEEGWLTTCTRPSRAKNPLPYWQIEVVPGEEAGE